MTPYEARLRKNLKLVEFEIEQAELAVHFLTGHRKAILEDLAKLAKEEKDKPNG